MDTLHVRRLQAEAYTPKNTEVIPPLTPQEQLQYEQLAFNAVRRATEGANAQRFIEKAATELDPQYGWVAQTAPEDIRHLSLTIDSFQDDYYSRHQKPANAQQIYRHVRMKVETDIPHPQDERSVLLLEALMNGDLRTGTTPRLPKFLA